MPYLKREAPDSVKDSVQAVEDRADKCYKLLRLLKRPANEANWALLTGMALQLETWQQRHGADSGKHKVRMASLDKNPVGFKFIAEHGKPVSRLIQKYTWSSLLEQYVNHALSVTEQYTSFLGIFPLWHKNHDQVDLLADGAVRFYLPNDCPRRRQVVAFQQGIRPRGVEYISPYHGPKKPESPLAMKLLADLYHAARSRCSLNASQLTKRGIGMAPASAASPAAGVGIPAELSSAARASLKKLGGFLRLLKLRPARLLRSGDFRTCLRRQDALCC